MSIFTKWMILICCFGIIVVVSQFYMLHYPKSEVINHVTEVKSTKIVPEIICSETEDQDPDKSEDILCRKSISFLKNFKNPCWYETIYTVNGSEATLKCLPYFHIFGVCKTGTTDFFRRLTFHPQIAYNKGVLGKETWFWSWRRYGLNSRNRTDIRLEEFIDMFDSYRIGDTKVSLQTGYEYSDIISGHGDPMDFWDHRFWRRIPQNDPYADKPTYLTPHLVKHVQPGIKLIVLLREPTERLYSHYYHGGYGRDADQFHGDVLSSLVMLYQCLELHDYPTCLYGKNLTTTLRIPLSASLYSIHLQEWFDVFPREQFLIIRNEDYSKDVHYTLLKTFKFLNLLDLGKRKVQRIADMPHVYESQIKRKEGSMHNETRQLLVDFFKSHNRKLAILLNDDAFLWKDHMNFKVIPKQKDISRTYLSRTKENGALKVRPQSRTNQHGHKQIPGKITNTQGLSNQMNKQKYMKEKFIRRQLAKRHRRQRNYHKKNTAAQNKT